MLDLGVAIDELELGGERYRTLPDRPHVRLDVSRTKGGYALRIRFAARLEGPCMRCLEDAGTELEVDSREVHETGEGEDPELRSPYVEADALDVSSWARDALVLALPGQLVCREDCRGLCAECGANLNEAGEHAHERAPDPRWAALSDIRFE